jgi:hypothetical protein
VELFFGLSPAEFAKKYMDIDTSAVGYCKTFYFLSTFMVCYLIIANSILAIYRTIYIKMTRFATHMIGEEQLICIFLFGGLFITTVISALFINGKSSTRAVYNMCMGHSQKFQVKKESSLRCKVHY